MISTEQARKAIERGVQTLAPHLGPIVSEITQEQLEIYCKLIDAYDRGGESVAVGWYVLIRSGLKSAGVNERAASLMASIRGFVDEVQE